MSLRQNSRKNMPNRMNPASFKPPARQRNNVMVNDSAPKDTLARLIEIYEEQLNIVYNLQATQHETENPDDLLVQIMHKYKTQIQTLRTRLHEKKLENQKLEENLRQIEKKNRILPKVEPQSTLANGQKLLCLVEKFNLNINDLTNPNVLLNLRSTLLKQRNKLKETMARDYVPISERERLKQCMDHYTIEIDKKLRENNMMNTWIRRLESCIQAWQAESERVPMRSMEQCMLAAIRQADSTSSVTSEPQNILADESDQKLEVKEDQTNGSEHRVVRDFQILLGLNKTREACNVLTNVADTDIPLMIKLLSMVQAMDETHHKSPKRLPIFFKTLLAKTMYTTREESTGPPTAIWSYLPKPLLHTCLRSVMVNDSMVLQKWILSNKALHSEQMADLLNRCITPSSHLQLLDSILLVYENTCQKQLAQLSLVSNPDKHSLMASSRRTTGLLRCRTKLVKCALNAGRSEYLVHLLAKWGVAEMDQSKNHEYPIRNLIELLINNYSQCAAQIVHGILNKQVISWSGLGKVIQNLWEDDRKQSKPESSSLVNTIALFLADLMDRTLENVDLKDQPAKLKLIANEMGLLSLEFWQTLLAQSRHESNELCDSCQHFELNKTRSLRVNRMVHVLQLAMAGIVQAK